MALHFPSKRDRWLGAVIWLAVLQIGAGIVATVIASSEDWDWGQSFTLP